MSRDSLRFRVCFALGLGVIAAFAGTATFGRRGVERALAGKHAGAKCHVEAVAILPLLVRATGQADHGPSVTGFDGWYLWLPGRTIELHERRRFFCNWF